MNLAMSLGHASTDQTFFAGETFARSRRLRKHSTYLIMNLTVAYLRKELLRGLWIFGFSEQEQEKNMGKDMATKFQ